jgi:MoxR-like ATPase
MMDLYYPEAPSPQKPSRPLELPSVTRKRMLDPSGYIRDRALADAVNVALLLRQPLLLTGEPGTGKSELAASIAWELGLDGPLVFETKSTSQARDLFYVYDTLGRFNAKQMGDAMPPAKEYITFGALGKAIIDSHNRDELLDILPCGYEHAGRRRSVVLIDEVEKAPRDLPNDILNEIERLYFRIPELGNVRVDADEELSPVIVLTSNSEKSLPDPFLRRCIYYNIPFPTPERLEEIALSRFAATHSEGSALLADAIAFLMQLRDQEEGLQKRPSTAELLNWLAAMQKLGAEPARSLRTQGEIGRRTLSALAKLADDQGRAEESYDEWLKPLRRAANV